MKGFVLDAQTIAICAGVIIPLLVALVTKQVASEAVKSVLNLLLSAVAGWFAVAQAGVSYDWKTVLVGIFYAFGSSIVSYYGFHKPTTIAPRIADKTSSFGLGKAA